MHIQIANTDEEIKSCYRVMKELRSALREDEFVDRIHNLQQYGYKVVFIEAGGNIVALAGFRVSENLAWKRYLYVDDLVTLEDERSKGFGARLLDWLTEHAKDEKCDSFHLDSGIQRKDAHRFYEREGLKLASYHYTKPLM